MATARKIVQHRFVTPAIKEQFNSDNILLSKAFLTYKQTTDCSIETIKNYGWDFNVIWYWNLLFNDNKCFIDWTKQDIIAFQAWCIMDCCHSSARVRRLKAVISSLSNYVEDILDIEYPNFRKIVHKIPNPAQVARLEKSVFRMHDVNALLARLTFTCQYEKACCLALAVCSGRRKAELLRFRVSDFTTDHLVCNGALYKSTPIRTKGRGVEGKKLECFILAPQFKPYLDRWMDYRERRNIQSEWLFPQLADTSKSISKSTLDDWANYFNPFMPMPFYWHSMRHLTATNFVRAGIPDTVIQEYFGWTNGVSMLKIYNDLPKEEAFAMYFNADGTYGGIDGKISNINMAG